jgi:hypothetical protein
MLAAALAAGPSPTATATRRWPGVAPGHRITSYYRSRSRMVFSPPFHRGQEPGEHPGPNRRSDSHGRDSLTVRRMDFHTTSPHRSASAPRSSTVGSSGRPRGSSSGSTRRVPASAVDRSRRGWEVDTSRVPGRHSGKVRSVVLLGLDTAALDRGVSAGRDSSATRAVTSYVRRRHRAWYAGGEAATAGSERSTGYSRPRRPTGPGVGRCRCRAHRRRARRAAARRTRGSGRWRSSDRAGVPA